MLRRTLCAGLTTGALLLAVPVAAAAPTATFTAGTLTITGEPTAESFTISNAAGNVQVAGPAGINDPDGAGADCTAGAGTASCDDAVVNAVVVNAGAGNDTLTEARLTSGDTDTLNGDAGDDTLANAGSGLGFDTHVRLSGGADNDALTKNGDSFFGFDDVRLDGGAGNDILNAGTGALGNETGGTGNDTFNGSAQQSDAFDAEAGSDTYYGGTRVPLPAEQVFDPATYQRFEVPDSISYSSRPDAQSVSLDGVANDGSAGEGDNVATDIERVFGGSAADVLTGGGAASVRISGGAGGDTVTGASSDDSLDGGAGTDTIAGGPGDDEIFDGDFTNTIVAPGDPAPPVAGNDRLDGGAGNDILYTDRGADDIIGGAGFDTAGFSRGVPQASTVTTSVVEAAFEISLDDAANDGVRGAAEGDNVRSDVEEVDTGEGADVVTGSAHAERFYTAGGNDTVTPGRGSDDVFTDRGDDTVNTVDQTTDRIDCGRGTDSASVDLPGGQPERADVTLDCETIGGQPFPVPNPPPTPLPPPPPLPPQVDIRKPVLVFSGSTTVKSKTFLKNGILPLKIACSKPCSLRGEAFSGRVGASTVGKLALGSGSLRLGTGTRTLKVKLSQKYLRPYKRRLSTKAKRKKGVKFSVVVAASDALGIQVRAVRTLTVKG